MLETVQVTGSRLSRTDAETPAPVQTITREEIARSGAVSLTEVLQKLPANGFGVANENDVARSRGAGGVSLRGLGAGSTLVLINGRRVAVFGAPAAAGPTTFVDPNQIPLGMVDRVEVLLDGASAVYGSDAVAGVVNVILRRSYQGAQVAAGYGLSTHGDARQREASATFGFGDLTGDGYNIFAGLSHLDQEPVKNEARWHSRSGDYRGFGLGDLRGTAGYPGNLYTADNRTFLQALPGCGSIGEPGSPLPGGCLSRPVRDLVTESKRDALFVAGTAALPHGVELFGDALIGRTVVSGQNLNFNSNSYSATGTSPVGVFLIPIGHPQNPYPFEVALRTRFADEPRVFTPTNDTQRVVTGLRHHDLDGWDVEGALLWSHSKLRATTRGVISDTVLHYEVFDRTGRAFPSFRFGDPGANDPAMMARLYPELVDVGTSSLAMADLRGTREVYRLPGGPAQIAVGAEVRRERFSTAVDPRISSGEISVLFGPTASGNRTVTSGYAELSLPIARTLEASLAGRYDHYSDVGGTANSKAGLKWQAVPGVALRSTYSTAFRAPSPTESNPLPSHVFGQVSDPKTCPVPSIANPNCDERVQIDITVNPGLKPERAQTATAGIIFEPWQGASFTIDAFRIHRRDQIAMVDSAYLLAHEDELPGSILRKADGRIDRINITGLNIAESRTWGVDATGKARTVVPDIGQVGVDGSYSWMPHFWTSPTPGAPLADNAGLYVRPKVRAQLSFSLDRGPWRSALTFNYTGSYLRAQSPSNLNCPYEAPSINRPELCSVSAWRTTDLFIGYAGFAQIELGLFITNVNNVQAPFDANQVPNTYSAYLSAMHSAIGRSFKLTAKYTFR
ncbi:MAG: TonB-dependent receptor [Caldimonas sp.]